VSFAKRAQGIWEGLWKYINTGDARQFGVNMTLAGVDIVANFDAKTKELPGILDRNIGGREQELLDKVATLGGDLANQFNDKLSERVAEFDGAFKDKEISVDLKPNDAAIKDAVKPTELKVVESRLLTRGKQEDSMQKMVKLAQDQSGTLKAIEKNTGVRPAEQPAQKLAVVG